MTTTVAVADRRRQALERLNGGPGKAPVRRRLLRDRRPAPAPRSALWDVQRGPAPAAYYVIAVVVALFVMLGLVMVLSASAATEANRGNSPYFLFNRQVLWAAIGLGGLVVGLRVSLTWVRRMAWPLLRAFTSQGWTSLPLASRASYWRSPRKHASVRCMRIRNPFAS